MSPGSVLVRLEHITARGLCQQSQSCDAPAAAFHDLLFSWSCIVASCLNCWLFLTEQEAKQAVSPAIIEAQAHLLAMRSDLQRAKVGRSLNHAALLNGRASQIKSKPLAQSNVVDCDACLTIGILPDHLGWGSRRFSQALRQSLHNKRCVNKEAAEKKSSWLEELQNPLPSTIDAQPVDPTSESWSPLSYAEVELGTVKLHPDIGVGILRKKMAAAGRVWLLLRWIDRTGSGRIEIAQVRDLLCHQKSAIRVCGWRQMRSLIAHGQSIFWTQRDGRLWLQSIPKIAQALGIKRLSGRPVALPVKILTQGIGQVRAHLFASFHSGRKHASPISRTTLSRISQVSARSQQNYEKRSRVRKLKNFAVGPKLSNENAKDLAWQHGSACFNWRDKKAVHGTQHTSYLAWQLPNSYLGPHLQRPHGRQRRFNRELAVLFAKGMTGNDHSTVEEKPKRYFDAAKKAARAQKLSQSGVYWRGKHPGLWYIMESPDQL
jgi:hypothetical protein